MRIKILGSSAGGGLPQWNCGCAQCTAARRRSPDVSPRNQSSLAVSADDRHWVLLNVSPDVRTQLAATPELWPPDGAVRASPVAAVVLTNADIDHAAGLLILREGGAPPIYATERVRRALTVGLSVLPVLSAYGAVEARDLVPGRETAVHTREGADTGLRITPFTVESKPPPYMLPHLEATEAADAHAGDTIGVVLRARDSKDTAVYVPGVKTFEPALVEACERARAILIDGTCFRDDELVALGASAKTARAMGHAPLEGEGGTLEFLARFPNARRVLVHINNTNPVLHTTSAARRALERAGVEVGIDGEEIQVK